MLLRMDLSNRIKSEGVAIFLKSVLLYVFLMIDLKLLSFALAYMCYSLVLIVMYNYLFRNENKLFSVEKLISNR
jgi:hypothetical protein